MRRPHRLILPSVLAVAALAATVASCGAPAPSNTQAIAAGAKIFAAKCQKCHGAAGVGGRCPTLNNGNVQKSFSSVANLQGFIKANMPLDNPGSLTNTQASEDAQYVWSLYKGK